MKQNDILFKYIKFPIFFSHLPKRNSSNFQLPFKYLTFSICSHSEKEIVLYEQEWAENGTCKEKKMSYALFISSSQI